MQDACHALKALIQGHVKNQSNAVKNTVYLAEKYEAVSFYRLSKREKREIAAYLLVTENSDYGIDLIINQDGDSIMQLIYDWKVQKSISAKKALNNLLDSIVEKNAHNIDEMFDDAVRDILTEEKRRIDEQLSPLALMQSLLSNQMIYDPTLDLLAREI